MADERTFYDKSMYVSLTWQNLQDQLDEDIAWVKKQPSVDPKRIYLLGHSEGTQVAVDYASRHREVAGVILLGYAGHSLGQLIDWQLFRRQIDFFVATDVDANHDGKVTKEEASAWPGLHWPWKPGQDAVSYAEIETALRGNKDLQKIVEMAKAAPLYSGGIFNRAPIYDLTASLSCPVYVFNGELDVQTPLSQVLPLKEACLKAHKRDCTITIIPGLTHGFSLPREPRHQPFLDQTVGPATTQFLETLTKLATKLSVATH